MRHFVKTVFSAVFAVGLSCAAEAKPSMMVTTEELDFATNNVMKDVARAIDESIYDITLSRVTLAYDDGVLSFNQGDSFASIVQSMDDGKHVEVVYTDGTLINEFNFNRKVFENNQLVALLFSHKSYSDTVLLKIKQNNSIVIVLDVPENYTTEIAKKENRLTGGNMISIEEAAYWFGFKYTNGNSEEVLIFSKVLPPNSSTFAVVYDDCGRQVQGATITQNGDSYLLTIGSSQYDATRNQTKDGYNIISVDKTKATSVAEAVVGEHLEYGLTNLTDNTETFSLESGIIGNLHLDSSHTNVNLTVIYPLSNSKSADILMRLICGAETSLAINSENTDVDGSDWTSIKAGTNYVMVTRTAYEEGRSKVLVSVKGL